MRVCVPSRRRNCCCSEIVTGTAERRGARGERCNCNRTSRGNRMRASHFPHIKNRALARAARRSLAAPVVAAAAAAIPVDILCRFDFSRRPGAEEGEKSHPNSISHAAVGDKIRPLPVCIFQCAFYLFNTCEAHAIFRRPERAVRSFGCATEIPFVWCVAFDAFRSPQPFAERKLPSGSDCVCICTAERCILCAKSDENRT